MQKALLDYVKVRKKKRPEMYRFVRDLPEILGPDGKRYGPFRAGDLVSIDGIPRDVWRVLERRNVVVVHIVRW